MRKLIRFFGFMAFSTNLISDLGTVAAATPATATTAAAIAAAGPIMDYPGNTGLLLTKAKEFFVLALKVLADTDAGDGQLANIKKICNTFDGGSR
jgi:broad specificity polyphosphatase/5'/3'-nucleotidase SurE